MKRSKKALTIAAALGLSLVTATMARATDCTIPAYEWDLALVSLERLEGEADLTTEREALGERALLRGSFTQPGGASVEDVTLSTEDAAGEGFWLTLEKGQP